MAQESGKTASSSASASAAGGDAYIGSFISLISKYEIRYEGVLYYLNPQDSTLGLNNVRSYGTEGRRKDGPQIPPSDKVYEYILFRGSDIKDLQVKSSPPAQAEELIHNDPAIIQSRYAGGPSSSSKSLPVVGGSFTDFGAYGDISALYTKSYTSARPPHQSGNQVEPWNPQAIQNTNTSSCAMPIHWQGYSGLTSNSTSHNPMQSTNPSLSTIGNLFQASPTQVSTTTALTYPSNCAAPGPMVITSNPAHLSITSSLLTGQLSAASSDLSSSSVKSSLPSYPEVLVGTRLSSSLVPSSSQNRSTIEAPSANKVGSDPVSFHPVQSSYTVPSVVDSSSGSLLNHPSRLLTPDQLLQPRVSELSSTQKLYPDQKDVGVLSSASSNSSSSVTSPAVQAPLLPLPPPSQKLQYSSEFAEEFDFEAMNEKFKKDEIWGYFGKAKQENKTEGTEDNSSVMGNDSSVTKVEAIPAYKKDEFFDTISRNSLSRGARNGQHHFSERMKLDTETFGNYQQRVHPGYAGYGAGHGQYNWRRGYHYGGRGRGRFTRT